MKIILLRDVPKVGKKYEVKEVKDGLARNFLIPQKYAEVATPSLIKKFESLQEKNKKDDEEKNVLIKEMLEKVSGQPITIKAKANEQGILFAAITDKDIVESIKSQCKLAIPLEWILEHPLIKKTGDYTITIEKGSMSGLMKISIEATK